LHHPALIAFARLVVIGGDGHRLHEEIIFAGGQIEEGKFVRFSALRDMQQALDAATDEEPTDDVKQKLLALWRRKAEALRQALDVRSRDRTDGLKEMLAKRAEKEVADITAILTELEQAIRNQLDDADYQQRFLPGLALTEQEQLERNLDALRRRLAEIPGEIQEEAESIRKRYAEPEPRMFPAAVTFLVPARLARERRA
jgi:hypothetical protein